MQESNLLLCQDKVPCGPEYASAAGGYPVR